MNIGNLLRCYRETINISTRDLAKELRMSNATISRIENGKKVDHVNIFKLINWLFT